MLKSRNEFPPGGFCYLQPETGWEAEKVVGGQSFTVVVNALIAHRKANPGLVKKHNWSTDFNTVANEVDAFNDARCRAHGWLNYVSQVQNPFPLPMPVRSPSSSRLASAAASVKRVAAGISTLLDWVGSGGRPVDKELAYSRAKTCENCPKNGKGDWTRYFTVPASNQIKLQLEIKNDLKLETPSDEELGVCEPCLCPLPLKVWCPLDHVLKKMDEQTKSKLNKENPVCWILSEEKS